MPKTDREIRGGIPAEIRAEADGIKVSGYAAVFNQEADIGGWFREVIAPGAFDDVLNDDVVFLINHDGLPLARTRSKTLVLVQDNKGLRMETSLDPDDPDVQSIVGKMQRGDLDKMSFTFSVGVQEWDDEQDPPLRTIKKVKGLYDVAIVTSPAYDGTDIGLRSLEKFRNEKQEKCGCETRGDKLGALIGRLRDEKDLSNDDLAKAAGISASTIGQIISGEITCPPMKRLEGMAKALGVSANRSVKEAEKDGCDYSKTQKSKNFHAARRRRMKMNLALKERENGTT